MRMLINVDVETIRVNERIRIKCYQHFVSRTCDIWWNIKTTVTGDQIEICTISIIGFQSVIWWLQLHKKNNSSSNTNSHTTQLICTKILTANFINSKVMVLGPATVIATTSNHLHSSLLSYLSG